MLERAQATSLNLQKKYPAIYRDFFATCQRVASASNSFLWTGEFAGFYGGLTICQKLPLRSYVGFETTFDKQITIVKDYCTFQSDKQEFTTATVDDRLCTNLQSYLERFYKDDKQFTGLRVHLLTEIPLGHSLGAHGAIAAALALLVNEEQDFEHVYSCAREILALSQSGHSSGATAYAALTAHNDPIVFFSDADGYHAQSIKELVNLQGEPAWPIDFGLIYTGIQVNAQGVILANNQTVEELDASTQQLNEILEGRQQLNFRQTYTDMLNMTAGFTVTALSDLFTKGSSNTVIERLFNSLNEYQNLLHILHFTNSATDLIYSRIHQLANKQLNDVGSGVKISGIGKGGAVFFALPYGSHRQDILNLIEELQQETGRPIWLDYASWLDGIGGQPGRIDQDVPAGLHSSFIDRDSLSVTVLNKGNLQKHVLTQEKFNEFVKELDVLLDKTTGKIMIGGTAVTSKELPSQKATVTILADLITRKNLTVSNSDLPSSYGENRYDLHGKIVLPLTKQVKLLTGRDLQLTVRGNMYDAYELALEPSNMIIGVVEKKN